jgi:signal transduction histidine kinase
MSRRVFGDVTANTISQRSFSDLLSRAFGSPSWWWMLLSPFVKRSPLIRSGEEAEGDIEADVVIHFTTWLGFAAIVLLVLAALFRWRSALFVIGIAGFMLALLTHWVHYHFGRVVALRVLSGSSLSGLVTVATVSGGLSSPAVLNILIVLIGASVALDRIWVRFLSSLLVPIFLSWAYLQTNTLLPKVNIPPSPLALAIHLAIAVVFINVPFQYAIRQRQRIQALLEGRAIASTALEDRLKKSLEAQKELFWHISHELRSPLTRLELAVRREFRAQETLPTIPPRIEAELDALRLRLDQVLVLAQLADGVDHFDTDALVDLTTLVDSICVDSAFEAEEQDRHVSFELMKASSINGNLFLLRAAFENVIRNAVRFTRPKSEVRVILDRPNERHARVTVLDEGPGVPHACLENIFRPFFQVPVSSETRDRGTGLGLAIARESIQRHGGSIHASNRPTRGLRVVIDLPLRGPSPEGPGVPANLPCNA